MTKRKILFYTHALSGGGAERVWALLASSFAQHGHDVIFAVDSEARENAGFLDAGVRSVTLGPGHFAALRRLRALIKAEQPDVMLSAIGVSNLKLFLAVASLGRLKRCILSIHGYFHSESQPLSQIGNLLAPLTSRLCGATIAVSEGLRNHVIKRWHVSRSRTTRIYNPVIVTMRTPPPTSAELLLREPIILAVGRMVEYKSYPMLIDAFAQVTYPGARLMILGEGAQRPAIEACIAASGLADRIELLGYHPEPWVFYARARCFALSSRSEAFGNVVVEALANGLPVVATHCHGPEEIMQGYDVGTLVEIGNAAAMAKALDDVLENPGDPAPRIARASDFNSETAYLAYERLIENVIANA